ncbi:hypothetical protein [Streptomyces omiyaensis]|uniref:Lipoprotein n=1 Tax=Streptomyces omiyaensis TaxID=68247 RepID=A0ABW7BXW2_9ACTN|nr:hypothetical protein [Streptomyces omiyaensis]GGY63696.1 hypothetical protein GCM10010363_51470 [Streptomyces omiyaensis]
MRRLARSAASVLVLGVLPGCVTVVTAARSALAVQQHVPVAAPPPGTAAGPGDNHGND